MKHGQHHLKEATIPVAGMTCAACVRKVEKALHGVPGVHEATVNLAAGKAGVTYDPAVCDVPAMCQQIEKIGYDVAAARIELLVLGMTPGHCEHVIGPAVRALPGVRDIQFNFATDTVTVEATPPQVRRVRGGQLELAGARVPATRPVAVAVRQPLLAALAARW